MKKISLGISIVLMMFQGAVSAHNHYGKPLTEAERQASEGIFNNETVQDRSLSDWDGVWQSVYGYLKDGALDPVLQQKAHQGEKSVEEYRKYYLKGYLTDIDSIGIENNEIEFYRGTHVERCIYHYDGYKILTYASGRKGVRYLFSCHDKHSGAPAFIQFSDHAISQKSSQHFHLFMGNNSHAALLKEMENWPTYYPYNMSQSDVVAEMLHH